MPSYKFQFIMNFKTQGKNHSSQLRFAGFDTNTPIEEKTILLTYTPFCPKGKKTADFLLKRAKTQRTQTKTKLKHTQQK